MRRPRGCRRGFQSIGGGGSIGGSAKLRYLPAAISTDELKRQADKHRFMEPNRKLGISGMPSMLSEHFGLGRTLSLVVIGVIGLVSCLAVYWFVHSAPPRTITMTSGPPGSTFARNAERYRTNLAASGVTLIILPSEGSQENLQRLENPASRVDIGFVQGGVPVGSNTQRLVSLGSVSYEPLLVFYRGSTAIKLLSELAGKRLAIGAVGSGTRSLALTLLQTNGITPGGATQLEDLDSDDAAQALLAGTVDAVFLMSDSASVQTMRSLMRSPGVRLLSFEQADAYARRFNYLNKLRLPEGSIDFARNLPPQDVWLIGPTVELVARPDLNSAVSDLLLEAAHDVHGNASILQGQGEFPKPMEHEFKISTDASRYYKSGKTFLYRNLPFWIASLTNRILVAILPVILLLIPGLRLIPAAYKWSIQLRIYRWYRKLLVLERELAHDVTPGQQAELRRRLDGIESAVRQLKMPASFAEQFYTLRGHIDFVRQQLARLAPPKKD
jgi:TRAP-type uncharacterized transport system substrate-binding protein